MPRFYSACKVLLESMGRNLSSFVSNPEGGAQALIESFEDAAAKAVDQDIKAHAKVRSNKDEEERNKGLTAARTWATRQTGHRVKCPACNSPALVQGNPSGRVATTIGDDEVVQRQTMLPSGFECIACGLRISGLSKLYACGLGDAFTAKTTYSAAEFFGLYTEGEIEQARSEVPTYEEDFDEY